MENPSIYNIDLDEVSHIEISESPGSIEYGGGSTAGYINIITKKIMIKKLVSYWEMQRKENFLLHCKDQLRIALLMLKRL